LIGDDVIDGIRCRRTRVDLHRAGFNSIHVGRDAKIEIRLRAGDGRA
jgi:hypothetical protein